LKIICIEAKKVIGTSVAECIDMDMISPDELEAWIKEEYFTLSGKPLTNEYMDFAVVKQFALCPCERMESAKEDA